MTPERVKLLLFEFMTDIHPGPVQQTLKIKWKSVLDELGNKLSKLFSKEREVDDYLNYILAYIDDLNKYFAKEKKGRVPYSQLFNFANKDERISEFLFDRGAEKKLSKSSSGRMAGFDSEDEEEDDDIIFGNEVYSYIYSFEGKKFFFSPVINEVAVKPPKGKTISYLLYKRNGRKYRGTYLKLSSIHRALRNKQNTESIKAFVKYMNSVFARNKARRYEARKTKKKVLRA